MGCTGCKKKTYKEKVKEIDKKTNIAILVIIIVLLGFGYGVISLLSLLW